ncbi:adenosylcobinamide-GDP ribazoletransferase [Leptolyngbya sp. 'hensonii']|nr:adenosylcobinamide-GDP ribazoletransferase [Leptolyngbya sp. 'hensonii']
MQQTGAAIAFYTSLPIPSAFNLDFQNVARLAPIVGLILGFILSLMDWGLQSLAVPIMTRSALVVVLWIALTGGLHLDGAMDTADGLAVQNPERRLEVMADSAAGAFGVMSAAAILLLKVAALSDLGTPYRWLALLGAAGWSRWGQQVAIAAYPYLKPTGKGAFHKVALPSLWHTGPSLVLLLILTLVPLISPQPLWPFLITLAIGGSTIALLSGAWFNHKLGGHTGDTYGAVVEWTEALLLCLLTLVS